MGDLVTEPVSGALYYADKRAFDSVLKSAAAPADKTALFADLAHD